jgi:hypothetical protein
MLLLDLMHTVPCSSLKARDQESKVLALLLKTIPLPNGPIIGCDEDLHKDVAIKTIPCLNNPLLQIWTILPVQNPPSLLDFEPTQLYRQ